MAKKQETKEVVSIDLICKQLQKKMGDSGLIVCLDENFTLPSIDVIDTGICTLNEALGVMGWPVGRIIELRGQEASGKTTLAIRGLAEAQKKFPDKKVAIIDVENSFDPAWAELNGLDCSQIIFAQPDDMENALDIVEALCETGAISMILIDSVAAMVPRAELEGNMEDQQMGLQARLMSKGLRKIKGKASHSKTTLIFINQFRSGIGPYASSKATPGGNALKYYASVIIEVKKMFKGEFTMLGEIIGITVEANIVKNKVAAPYKVALLPLYFAKGFSDEHALVTAAAQHGIVHKGGTGWFTWKEQKFHGAENFARVLEENTELFAEIRQAYEEKIKGKKIVQVKEEEEETE